MSETRTNELVMKYAKKFANAELLSFIRQAEKHKWFGTLYYHPERRAVAEFVFQDGICLRCIEPEQGQNCTFNKSEKFW